MAASSGPTGGLRGLGTLRGEPPGHVLPGFAPQTGGDGPRNSALYPTGADFITPFPSFEEVARGQGESVAVPSAWCTVESTEIPVTQSDGAVRLTKFPLFFLFFFNDVCLHMDLVYPCLSPLRNLIWAWLK